MMGNILLVIRWAARLTGLVLVGLILLFVAGEGPPNPLAQPPAVQVELVAMLTMLVGFLIGWRWEGVGALLVMGGFALFCAAELAFGGRLPGGAIPLFVIPGLLYLLGYWLALVQRTRRGNDVIEALAAPQKDRESEGDT